MAVVPKKALGVREMLEQDYCKICFYQIIPPHSSNGLLLHVYIFGSETYLAEYLSHLKYTTLLVF